MVGRAISVSLTARQRKILEGFTRAHSTPQQMAERCWIVLMSADGYTNLEQAAALDVDRQRVGRWRTRWVDEYERLAEAEEEGASDKDLEEAIFDALSDDPRSGAPPKFAPEQVAAIIALACEAPKESGLPISHWTAAEVALEAIRRGIVESISARQVDRFLANRVFGPTCRGTG